MHLLYCLCLRNARLTFLKKANQITNYATRKFNLRLPIFITAIIKPVYCISKCIILR